MTKSDSILLLFVPDHGSLVLSDSNFYASGPNEQVANVPFDGEDVWVFKGIHETETVMTWTLAHKNGGVATGTARIIDLWDEGETAIKATILLRTVASMEAKLNDQLHMQAHIRQLRAR